MDGKELRVVEVKTGKELQVIKGHECTIYAVAYSPDGKRILGQTENCSATLGRPNGKTTPTNRRAEREPEQPGDDL